MKSATMVSDISEHDDSLVVKYIEQIPHYVDVPYKYWVKPYNVKDRYYDYNEGGFKWGYVKKGGYYTTRYKSVRKEFPSSSSIIYKNGIAYFITIVSFYNEYTSAELYDMIIPCLRLVNVKMKQLHLYALTFFILIFAIVVILIMHRYIKKYIHEQNKIEKGVTYNMVLAKIIWLYAISCYSCFIVINFDNAARCGFVPFYFTCYVALFIYYFIVIIKVREFGVKQILFYEILQKGRFIKEEWEEIKKRTVTTYWGVFLLSIFYIIPCILSCLLIDFKRSLDYTYYTHKHDPFFYLEEKFEHGNVSLLDNIDVFYDIMSIITLVICLLAILVLITRIWIYSPQKRIENNGENKQL